MQEPQSTLKPLRERVYRYLKEQMNAKKIEQGAFLNLGEISEELGMSRTPLRDALLLLEAEGFVTIFPRRGVMVNSLDLCTIRNIYEILGALESVAIVTVRDKFRTTDLERMTEENATMKEALEADDFERYYARNLAFHNAYLDLSENNDLLHTVRTLKERLYDFPRSKGYVREWERSSVLEHDELIAFLSRSDWVGAATYIRDVHWSFAVQERFIRRYYFAPYTNGNNNNHEGAYLL